jgi:dihydrofolate reductase
VRRLKIAEHVSLDGVIQHSDDGDGFPYRDWSSPYRTAEGLNAVIAAYGERYDLLLGRRTYDSWSRYWPNAASSPMADRLNAATKFVATHRPESLEWGPAEGTPARSFELQSSCAMPSGVGLNSYRFAGPLKNM